jgi:hypothetical protein
MLAASPASISQTNDQRIEDVRAEITLLKRIIAEQDRRIAELETAVKVLQLGTSTSRQAATPDRGAVSVQPTSTTPWKTPTIWSRLKNGMSRAQVVAILGQPTSVKTIGPYLTLFYQGEVAGSGSVTGTVELTDDRVWQVNIPVF